MKLAYQWHGASVGARAAACDAGHGRRHPVVMQRCRRAREPARGAGLGPAVDRGAELARRYPTAKIEYVNCRTEPMRL